MQVTPSYLTNRIRETCEELKGRDLPQKNQLDSAATALIELCCSEHFHEFLTSFLYDKLLALEKPEEN